MSNRTLRFLDEKLTAGQAGLTSREVRERLGLSPQAASNLLTRWREVGLVDRVAPGHYAIRQLGLLGTRAASEDVALAVGAFFAGEPHRIAYRSALDCHGLLTHPARTIQVACPREVTVKELSGRPLRTIIESRETVLVGAVQAGHGARVSGLERSLLDGAARMDLIGGANVLAEALSTAQLDPAMLQSLAQEIGAATALRRLGSLADQLPIPALANRLQPLATPTSDIQLEPQHPATGKRPFRDRKWRVVWAQPPATIAEGLEQ
ncbi:MAG TPA: MarR family transcriptional regulator [Solirubrobacteraceae bacterium]|nr:MarR family transcriptional regulator [Solirubrobacteraceae bacterium]